MFCANLKSSEAEHTWEHPQHDISFLCTVDELVHVVAVLHDLRRYYMRAIFSQNSLVVRPFLSRQSAEVGQMGAIDREGVPQVVLSREEGTDGQRVLGKQNGVDRGKSWMPEGPDQPGRVQVVEVCRSIE